MISKDEERQISLEMSMLLKEAREMKADMADKEREAKERYQQLSYEYEQLKQKYFVLKKKYEVLINPCASIEGCDTAIKQGDKVVITKTKGRSSILPEGYVIQVYNISEKGGVIRLVFKNENDRCASVASNCYNWSKVPDSTTISSRTPVEMKSLEDVRGQHYHTKGYGRNRQYFIYEMHDLMAADELKKYIK